MASANVEIGFLMPNSSFLNYNIYSYKKVRFDSKSLPQPQFVNLEDVEANEIGLEIRVDTNNRPRRRLIDQDLSLVSQCDLLRNGCHDILNSLLGDDFAKGRRLP